MVVSDAGLKEYIKFLTGKYEKEQHEKAQQSKLYGLGKAQSSGKGSNVP